MRASRSIAFVLAVLLALPGCAWFVLGGAAAVALLATPEEVQTPETPPSVVIMPVSSPASGDVAVPFTLTDAEGDPADVAVSYSTDGTAFQPATAVPGTLLAGLATSPDGVLHTFTWDSLTDIGTAPQSAVWISITPSGAHGAGATKVTPSFSVDNNGAPVAAAVTPAGPHVEAIAVAYTLSDAESDAVDVVVEWRAGAAGVFESCTAAAGGDGTTGLVSSPGGTAHVFVWDSEADTTCTNVTDVEIRVSPSDAVKTGSSSTSVPFTVLNNDAPAVESIQIPAGPVTGTATLEYVLSDSHADTSQIEAEYRIEPGGAWTAATPDATLPATAMTNRATSVAGVTHLFPWNSGGSTGDLAGEDEDVLIRIRARDGVDGIWGAWLETAQTLSIRNDTAPVIEIGAVRPVDRGMVRVPYTFSDAEGDEVTLLAEFRPLGDAAWFRATAGPRSTLLHRVASPSGTDGLFVWDTVRDGFGARNVEFRLTASQTRVAGLSSSAVFNLGNDSATVWFQKAPVPDVSILAYAASVAVEGRIYLFGGYGSAGPHRVAVLEYDPVLDAWTAKAGLPTARSDLACAELGGKAYVMGGYTGSATVNVVEAYDPVTDTWTTRSPMPTARSCLGCAAVDGTIYAVGGTADGSTSMAAVEAYDPVQDTWATRTVMPTARYALSCEAAGGILYAAGGRASLSVALDDLEAYDPASDTWTTGLAVLPTPQSYAASGSLSGRVILAGGTGAGQNRVMEYDPAGDTWATMTAMPTLRYGVTGATLEDSLFAIGGFGGGGIVEEYYPPMGAWFQKANHIQSSRSFATAGLGSKLYAVGGYMFTTDWDRLGEYDPSTNLWTQKAAMPTRRRLLAFASTGGKLYAVGGTSFSSGVLAANEEYDPTADTWAVKTPMPSTRSDLACCALNGKIYAVGGGSAGAVEAYDPTADTWTTLASLPVPRGNLGCAAWDGKLVAIGGRTSVQAVGTVEVYDPGQDTWTPGPSLLVPRYNHGCCVWKGRIYAIGGQGATGALATSEEYDPATNTWSQCFAWPPTLDPPGYDFFQCATVGGEVYALSYMNTTFKVLPRRRVPFAVGAQDLPSACSGGVLAQADGTLFLVGGWNGSSTALADCARFQVVTDVPSSGPFEIRQSWLACTGPATARRGAGSATHAGAVYLAGGFDGAGAAQSSMEVYDPATDTWTAAPAPLPTARGGLAFVAWNGKLYALGGDTGSAKSGVVEIYDPATQTWTSGAALTTARSHFGCAVDPETGMIYALGGEDGSPQGLSSVERYDPTGDAWTTMGATLPVALRGPLCLREDRTLLLFGGQKPDGTMSDRVVAYDPQADQCRTETALVLPYAARDMAGCSFLHAWRQRVGTSTPPNQIGRFCYLGGGYDGQATRSGFFRFYTR